MSTFVGIDIGTTAVKACAIQTAYRKVQLLGLSSVELSSVESPAQAIAVAVRTLLGDKGGVGDAIAVSMEGHRAAVRTVGLPASAQKQLAEVLPFELESALPFDLDESVFDFRVLTAAGDRKGEELQVLVGVAKTADVASRIDLVKTALSAEPERVGLAAFPIANLVLHAPALAEGVLAIVDLGTTTSDVIVLRNGEPVFGRTLALGTKGLPQTAAKLARELRTTVSAWRAQGGEPPTRVLLCGGGAYVGGAEAFLASSLELPVERLVVPTLEATTLQADHVATLARFAKAIGLAAGLAAGPKAPSLNLRRGPLAFERGFAWVREKVPLLAGLAAVLLVSFLFSAWAQLYATGKERDVLEKAMATVSKDVLGEETSSAERASELLASQTTVADEDPLPHADAFDVMAKLSEHIPTSIVHDIEELDIQKAHVIVHGVVGSIPDTQTIKTNLATEKCFTEPKVSRTTAQVGSDRWKYVLEFDIKCPEDQKGGAKKSATAAASASAPAPETTGGK